MPRPRRRSYSSLSQGLWKDLCPLPQFNPLAASSGTSQLSGPTRLWCLNQVGNLDLSRRYLEKTASSQPIDLFSPSKAQGYSEEPHHIHPRQSEGGIRRILQQPALVHQEGLELVLSLRVTREGDKEIQPSCLEVTLKHHRTKLTIWSKARLEEVLWTIIGRVVASTKAPRRLEDVWKEHSTPDGMLEGPQCFRCHWWGLVKRIHVGKPRDELQQHRTQSSPCPLKRWTKWSS